MTKKGRTFMIAILGLLIAVQIILSRFCSISAWNIKIGFGFVPIAVAGLLFGPIPAAVVGGLSDFLGAVLFPIGPYFPGFTLTAALTGLVYGLLLHKKQDAVRTMGTTVITQFVLSLFLNTLWISILYGSTFKALFMTRIFQCLLLAPVEFIAISAITKPVLSAEKRLAV